MTYTKSKHFEYFQNQIAILINAVNLVDGSSSVKVASQGNQDIKELVFCSAILLTSAEVEKYIENILSSWGNYINSRSDRSRLKNSNLPKNLTNYKLLLSQKGILDNFYRDRDELKLLDALSKKPQILNYAIPNNKITYIDFSKIYSDRKYPSPKNFNRLFLRLGIPTIFNVMASKSKSNMYDILDSFNSLRTQIAHGGGFVGLTKKDIVSHLSKMENFISILDQVLYDHIFSFTGQASWKYIKRQPTV